MKRIITVSMFIMMLGLLMACETTEQPEEPTKTLSSLEVVLAPSKTTYIEGETFDATGASMRAHYEWSDETSTTADVTASVTYNKTTLALGDSAVVASYTEDGVTKTADIAVVVNPLGELIGDGLVLDEPSSSLVITTNSTRGNATSYWYTEYQEEGFYIKVIVVDPSLDEGTNTYNADGVEVSLFHVARGEGLINGTLLINTSVRNDLVVQKVADGQFVTYPEHEITSTFNKVSFEGIYVEGYQIELLIPYDELDLETNEKQVSFLPGLYNNQGALVQVNYIEGYEADANLTRTFIWVKDDNTYEVSPWLQLGYVFGSTSQLQYEPVWNLNGDDGTEDAFIEMNGITAGTDNNVYMYREDETELYAYVKLSAKQVHGGEQYGKFGITVTTLDGANGFFFFIDAAGNGTNMTGTNVAVVNKTNNNWTWPERVVDTLPNAAVYQDDNFIELAIYRYGDIFEFYVNGESVSIRGGFPGLTSATKAVVGLATFNISIKAKEYGITTDEADLLPHRFEPQDTTYLFIGDSYVDTAFWSSFDVDFPSDAINLGVGGTKIDYWKEQAATLATLYNPEHIIIHIGVNDINDGDLSGSVVLPNLVTLIEALNALYPDAGIHFVSIEPNNYKPTNFAQYQIVNAGIEALALETDYLHYIDTVTPLGGEAGYEVAQYFIPDGLHLNPDGYGLWVRAIKLSLGIDVVETEGNLGNYGAYARSSGWVFEDEYVENIIGGEQQIYFEGTEGTQFAASVEINVQSVYNSDSFPKVGLAIKGASKTVFFFIDVNPELNNTWGNYVVRNSGADWVWAGVGGLGRQFVNLGSASYSGDAYKTIEIIRVGTAIYFISDGRVVQYAEGLFEADEVTQLSVLGFNLQIRLKNATIYEDEDFENKLNAYKVAEKDGPVIDGDLSDWNATVLENATHIYGSDERNINIYAFMAPDGVYVAYEALHNSAVVSNVFNWWENTNIEFMVGTNHQRFVSANGMHSRFETSARDVGTAKFMTLVIGDVHRTTFEVFIPWAMIEGYSYESPFIPAAFAWKQPSEDGSIWGGGDFWFIPEAGPGTLNRMITKTGFYQPTEKDIDGDLSDWSGALDTGKWSSTQGTREFTAQAYLGEDGVYGFFTVDLDAALNLNVNSVADNWWQNPNIEVWVNDLHIRVMIYDGFISATGRVGTIAHHYDAEDFILTIEYFIPYHALELTSQPANAQFRIGSNSLNGGWFMPVDPNQTITSSGLPPQ